MTDVWKLPIPLVFDKPALTANQRLHWAEKARRTAMVREHVAWRARQAKLGSHQHIVVQLHFVPPDRRRRDPSNLVPTQKPAVDGLVDAGVVDDDTPQWVTELMPVIHPSSSGCARMWLEVRPAPAALSDEDRRAIAEDVRFERAADAADRGEGM